MPYIIAITHTPPEVTVHSRAARRAASPSIDLDKTLKKTTRDSTSPSRPSQAKPHALAAQNAGIQKKTKKGNMTRAQRLRHQKGLERAEDILAKRQVNVVKSLRKMDTIKERAKMWEDVNGEPKKKKKTHALDDVDDTEAAKKDREWVSDEEMDEAATAVTAPSTVQNREVSKTEDDAVLSAGIPPMVEDELL
jgi:hypothetical protein